MADVVVEDRRLALLRQRQFDAELRVNLIRIAAVGAFYLIHLLHHSSASGASSWTAWLGLGDGGTLGPTLHTAVTCLVLAWIAAALVVHQMLAAGRLPSWLAYGSTLIDVALLTGILVLSSGAASPLVAGYFLILIMAGLRYDLRLVRVSTGAALAGYLFLLGCARWPLGLSKINVLPIMPRYQQLMVLTALLLAGLLVGQSVRHARRFLDEYVRLAEREADA